LTLGALCGDLKIEHDEQLVWRWLAGFVWLWVFHNVWHFFGFAF